MSALQPSHVSTLRERLNRGYSITSDSELAELEEEDWALAIYVNACLRCPGGLVMQPSSEGIQPEDGGWSVSNGSKCLAFVNDDGTFGNVADWPEHLLPED